MKTTRRWNKAANQYYDVLCNMYLYIQRGILIVIIERGLTETMSYTVT